jgi:hypothetical protein
MARFRKKPVVIEAWPVRELTRAAGREWAALPQPIMEAYERGDVLFPVVDDGRPYISIRTLEGIMDGQRDDWIIQGVKGELYPCKPDIFEATYEAVT